MLVLSLLLAGAISEAQILEAIQYGTEADRSVSGLAIASGSETCGVAWTPWYRIAGEAYRAARRYAKFERSDVTADMLRPQLTVYAAPRGKLGTAASADAVVIVPAGGGRQEAQQPASVTPEDVSMSNAYGKTVQARALIANFPLDALRDGSEVRIVYDDGAECALRIRLEDWPEARNQPSLPSVTSPPAPR